MPIHSAAFQLTYFPVPKVANSSVRSALHAVEIGADPATYRHGPEAQAKYGKLVTPLTAAKPFEEAWADHQTSAQRGETLVLVRDPLRRFLSAFQNKIRNGRLAEKRQTDAMPQTGLSLRPNLEVFVEHFDVYARVYPMVRRHFAPMTFYLGEDLSRFDHVFQLERFETFERFMSARLGREMSFPVRKRSNLRWVSGVPQDLLQRIQRSLAGDYRLLHRHYGADPQGIAIPDWLRDVA